ncbi:MAG: hypothetical protein SOY60_05945 [Fusobacterium gastrosuis]|uniref:hypothetical protein n=1 Tax=Fusobacterium gastrosuis TaxID=1755100 RepID=UPI002A84CBD5|nr:hypothetical protein [Fusobacterium gastrosuis]
MEKRLEEIKIEISNLDILFNKNFLNIPEINDLKNKITSLKNESDTIRNSFDKNGELFKEFEKAIKFFGCQKEIMIAEKNIYDFEEELEQDRVFKIEDTKVKLNELIDNFEALMKEEILNLDNNCPKNLNIPKNLSSKLETVKTEFLEKLKRNEIILKRIKEIDDYIENKKPEIENLEKEIKTYKEEASKYRYKANSNSSRWEEFDAMADGYERQVEYYEDKYKPIISKVNSQKEEKIALINEKNVIDDELKYLIPKLEKEIIEFLKDKIIEMEIVFPDFVVENKFLKNYKKD